MLWKSNRQKDRWMDGQAQTNMPPKFLQSWEHENISAFQTRSWKQMMDRMVECKSIEPFQRAFGGRDSPQQMLKHNILVTLKRKGSFKNWNSIMFFFVWFGKKTFWNIICKFNFCMCCLCVVRQFHDKMHILWGKKYQDMYSAKLSCIVPYKMGYPEYFSYFSRKTYFVDTH